MYKTKVIKRNGEIANFDRNKIVKAVMNASSELEDPHKILSVRNAELLAKEIEENCNLYFDEITVEDIQDMVEEDLLTRAPFVAQRYIKYRTEHTERRRRNTTDFAIQQLLTGDNLECKTENSNKNEELASVKRDYIAGIASKDYALRYMLPENVVEAHKAATIHFHDLDYYAQPIYNCCLINLEDMLQNGTLISDVAIETPKSFLVACKIATQIISQVASSQYGGQSLSYAHLAPFVDVSRKKWRDKVAQDLKEFNATQEQINERAEQHLLREIADGVQLIQYEVITSLTTNGQTPFVTWFMYLGEAKNEQEKHDLALIFEEVLKQRMRGVKNSVGAWVTPSFPKIIYVLEEDNVHVGSEYYYLTEMSAKCTAKRMVPDYISEKVMKENKVDKNGDGHCYPVMGCRSALTPYVDENNQPKYYGRFNMGVVTINLPHVALTAGSLDEFWDVFDERLELCHVALLERYEHLRGVKSDVAPILWQHGAISRLNKGETIDKLLTGGYATISLGFAGLYECVQALIGQSHTTEEGRELGLQIMQYMNDKCNEWKAQANIDFSLYGTPLESTTGRFAEALQRDFGVIENVSDKPYITNSYHVHVTEKIDAFSKLAHESEFQALSPGGAISYVETSDLTHNIPAVLSIMEFIYDNIMYAELNTKSDYCHECNYEGEIIAHDIGGDYVWVCPNCGNDDYSKMDVVRRTCGYLGEQLRTYARTSEIMDRELHDSIVLLDVEQCNNPSAKALNELEQTLLNKIKNKDL